VPTRHKWSTPLKIFVFAVLLLLASCATETIKKPASTIPADYLTSLQPPVALGEESIIMDKPYEGFQGLCLVDAAGKKAWIYWNSRKADALLLGKINSAGVVPREVDYTGSEGTYLLFILDEPNEANDPDVRLIRALVKKRIAN